MTEHIDLLKLAGTAKIRFTRQNEATECGLACIAMVASFHGLSIDLVTLRQRYEVSLKGATLSSLVNILDDLAFDPRPIRAELSELSDVAIPAILHWDLNHFVVFSGIKRSFSGSKYLISDPAYGPRELSAAEMSASFTGVLLEVRPSRRFTKRTERPPLQLSQMWRTTSGLAAPISQVIVLSLILQIFALASPFFMQIAVDTALPAGDRDLLLVLAFGFGGLALTSLIVGAMRDMIILRMGSLLSFGLVNNLFRRLVRLPLSYFEKRHTGDVLSRLDSAQPLSDVVSHGLVSVLIDGIMAITAAVLMLFYSPPLALLCTTAVAALIGLRFLWFGSLKLANLSSIASRSAESSTLIETLRGITTIKLMNGEADRHRLWANRRSQVINTGYKLGRFQTMFDFSSGAVLALERILFVFLAVRFAISATMTVGMIFAFQAFKDNFVSSSSRLINQWLQYKMLDVHLTRMGDIVLSEPDVSEERVATRTATTLAGRIDVRQLGFSYGRDEPRILDDISFTIGAGETVAIIGPSGCGKTTLMKLLLGLYQPTAGAIFIDGEPLARLGLSKYREQVAAVLQDDSLYAGTIAENISFFRPDFDLEKIRSVARLAAIDSEILAMPMGYDSLVGDMGSALSGGQKQRIVLARALYRDPRILFLDEGTAHLDVHTEAVVSHNIANLGITRVIIAHRPETVRSASRHITIERGRLV